MTVPGRARLATLLALVVAPAFAQSHAHPIARPTYAAMVRAWHTPVPDRTVPADETGRAKLVLVALNTQERVELGALRATGGWDARELGRASHLLREPSSGNEHPVEPRVLDAVYRIQTHFSAQEIRVVSGYRTPNVIASSRGSNHGRGRAIDLVVPGASDQDVAKFARDMGFMGVGIYPASGFVHVDVRERSYFWVDTSGPGGRNRERGILADIATHADHEASGRGERGLSPPNIGSDVDALLGGSAPPPAPALDEDED
jgi:uncharacterized protein YcbK (DUF882 family)